MPITKLSGAKKKTDSKNDSFLEAFRDIGSDIFPQAQSQDIFSHDSENEFQRRLNQQLKRAEIVRHEERILFTRKERETQQQVSALQDEIRKLAKVTGELAQQAEVASLEIGQNVGSYHINFLIKLIETIKKLRKQLSESSFWLAAWNNKSQKKNHYWGQFKKSGSKFLLSADRYAATQAG